MSETTVVAIAQNESLIIDQTEETPTIVVSTPETTFVVTHAQIDHNHNHIYYTEDEVDTFLDELQEDIDQNSDNIDTIQNSPGQTITASNISNWNTAFGWGNHADAGYSLIGHIHDDRYYTEAEIDQMVSDVSDAFTYLFGVMNGLIDANTQAIEVIQNSVGQQITQTNVDNWNEAFGWGNHADAGYLTSFTETDPVFSAHVSSGITAQLISNWNEAFGWGNHADAGYLTSYTETDPVFSAWDKSTGINITASQVSDFNTAVSNNSAVQANTAKVSFPGFSSLSADYGFTDNSADWNTAFSWGNHALSGYLTSYTETDPVFSAHPASGITAQDIVDWSAKQDALTPAQLSVINRGTEDKGSVSGTVNFDLASYSSITLTLGGVATFGITGSYPSNKSFATEVLITNGGAYAITWPALFQFASQTDAALTVAGVDSLTFITRNGTVCRVLVNGKDMG